MGDDWGAMVDQGRILNAKDGARLLGTDAEGMATIWAEAAAERGRLATLAHGLRVGRFATLGGKKPHYIYIINGFFPSH